MVNSNTRIASHVNPTSTVCTVFVFLHAVKIFESMCPPAVCVALSLCNPNNTVDWGCWERALRQWCKAEPTQSYVEYAPLQVECYALLIAYEYLQGKLMSEPVSGERFISFPAAYPWCS